MLNMFLGACHICCTLSKHRVSDIKYFTIEESMDCNIVYSHCVTHLLIDTGQQACNQS